MKNNLEKLVGKGGEPEVLLWIQESGLFDPEGGRRELEKGPSRRSASEGLIKAATGGFVAIVEMLLKVSDPKARDSRALRMAAEYGHQDIVEMLIPMSDPKAERSQALRLAARGGHKEIVEMLIPVSDPLAGNSAALRLASQYGYQDIVKMLIPVSDPKACDSVALRFAALNGHKEIVETLLSLSDLGAKNLEGETASDLARRGGFMEVAGLIDAYALSVEEKRVLGATSRVKSALERGQGKQKRI